MLFMLNFLFKYLKIVYEYVIFVSLLDVKKKLKIIIFYLYERKQVNRLDEKNVLKRIY